MGTRGRQAEGGPSQLGVGPGQRKHTSAQQPTLREGARPQLSRPGQGPRCLWGLTPTPLQAVILPEGLLLCAGLHLPPLSQPGPPDRGSGRSLLCRSSHAGVTWRSYSGKEGFHPSLAQRNPPPHQKKCYEHDSEPATPVQVSSAPRPSKNQGPRRRRPEARQSSRAGVALSSQANRIVAGKESHQLLWASGMGLSEGQGGPHNPIASPLHHVQVTM